jgi:membrane associated rhomboid family serine protease
VELDVCYPCAVVWFDANETDVLRVMYGSEPPPGKKVDRRWKWVLALLGVPVRQQHQQGLTRPWLTWGIALAVGAIFFTTSWLPALGSLLSLVPASVGRMAGLTVLTTFVLHGGWLHLFGNLCFLIIFGGPVEDYLGRARYLLLLVLATAAGSLFQVALAPHSTVPVVGASGGTAGLVVFYGLLFPRVRLVISTVWLLFYPLRIRAGVALLLWMLMQALGAWNQIHGFAGTAYAAHLGGGAVGLLFWLAWRTRFGTSPASAGTLLGARRFHSWADRFEAVLDRVTVWTGAIVVAAVAVVVVIVAQRLDPLQIYATCTFSDGLALVGVVRTPGDRSVATKDGPARVSRGDGYSLTFAYPNTDPFVNLRVDASRSGEFARDRQAIAAAMEQASARQATAVAPVGIQGFEGYTLRTSADSGVIDWYSLFDEPASITLTAYFLRQRPERQKFRTLAEYETLRDQFLRAYLSCIPHAAVQR